jgi:hypothetical protein
MIKIANNLLKHQIVVLLKSNIDEEIKDGLHNLLSEISVELESCEEVVLTNSDIPSYIYALFDGDNQIDQTSLDEMNENLAWEIMVDDEGRNPKGLSVGLVDEVYEYDN